MRAKIQTNTNFIKPVREWYNWSKIAIFQKRAKIRFSYTTFSESKNGDKIQTVSFVNAECQIEKLEFLEETAFDHDGVQSICISFSKMPIIAPRMYLQKGLQLCQKV